jgi:hypothetical protein
MTDTDENELRRPLGLILLTGLYLFFFLLTASTFGHSFPFMGTIYSGMIAKGLVFVDSIICLYLFLGILKRQLLTWYFVLLYNCIEIINTIVNLSNISLQELEQAVGNRVNKEALWTNNIAAALAILLLSQYIYRHKHYFNNKHKYLF